MVGLESGLVTDIGNLRIQLEIYQAPSVAGSNPGIVHPDRLSHIKESTPVQGEQSCKGSRELESEQSCTSEDDLHDQVLENWEEFSRQAELDR